MPAPANIHIDTFLTNYSHAYTNENMYADRIAPITPVDKRSDKYLTYNKDTFLRSSGVDAQGNPQSIRAPGTRSTEMRWDVSNQAFYCEEIAKHRKIPFSEYQYADAPLQIDADTTMALTETLRLDYEIMVASQAMKRGNYASANKTQLVVNTTSWASGSASKPFSVDLPAAKKQVFLGMARRANTVALNYTGALSLQQTDEYVQRIKYVTKEALTQGGLLTPLSGLNVIELENVYATSHENISTYTTGQIWADDQATPQDCALVHYQGPSNGLRVVSFMKTFEAPDQMLNARGIIAYRWQEPWNKAEVIEVATTRDVVFPATDGSSNGYRSNGYAAGGYLISGISL